ncbi:xanthine dehydrogenase accessory factor [Arthrobacter pascens]|uniref:XdhC family protein n=1 Tax=Arthrobacter pascens TaxID=1677 RepID=UPI002787F459|nr:XdhC family protein [Arthrobacter pascens]MDQ0632550.1 xanthine dehydrogenase accessory factor [Arthrobacter pascens]
MLDLIPSLSGWTSVATGQRFAIATIVSATGSAPRPVGTSMLVSESGSVLGSLSGGCVEGAVVAAALESIDDGGIRRERFAFSTTDAFAVGLTCGGELDVHIEPAGPDGTHGSPSVAGLQRLASSGASEPLALIRRIDSNGSGLVTVADPATFVVTGSAEIARLLGLDADLHPQPSDTAAAMLAAAAQLEPLLHGGRTGLVRLAPAGMCVGDEPITLLVESRLPAPRMLVFGANDFSAALLPAARLLSYHVTLVDARPAFASQERFSSAHEVVIEWPHRYLAGESAAGRVDARTVLCVLTHDPKFDIPLLETALALDVAFVGALGSRRSHLHRVDALLEAGVRPERIAALHSPLGLDLGAVTPAEVAVSITAEIIAARNPTASHVPLQATSGPIHRSSISNPIPTANPDPISSGPASEAAPAHAAGQETAWT